jgi:hypothetical protein
MEQEGFDFPIDSCGPFRDLHKLEETWPYQNRGSNSRSHNNLNCLPCHVDSDISDIPCARIQLLGAEIQQGGIEIFWILWSNLKYSLSLLFHGSIIVLRRENSANSWHEPPFRSPIQLHLPKESRKNNNPQPNRHIASCRWHNPSYNITLIQDSNLRAYRWPRARFLKVKDYPVFSWVSRISTPVGHARLPPTRTQKITPNPGSKKRTPNITRTKPFKQNSSKTVAEQHQTTTKPTTKTRQTQNTTRKTDQTQTSKDI